MRSLGKALAGHTQVVKVAASLVGAALLVLAFNAFIDWQADRATERDRRACRQEVLDHGTSPDDALFDLAVAACAIDR